MKSRINTVERFNYYLSRYETDKDGRNGKAGEASVCEYICNRKRNGYSRQGVVDMRTKRITIANFCVEGEVVKVEVKTGCPEIENAEDAQIIIYCPYVYPDIPLEEQFVCFTLEQWKRFLTGYPGKGQFLREDKKRGHWHIQSFYVSETVRPTASKAIARYIQKVCDGQPRVCDVVDYD